MLLSTNYSRGACMPSPLREEVHASTSNEPKRILNLNCLLFLPPIRTCESSIKT
jgi:hypothetical protein